MSTCGAFYPICCRDHGSTAVTPTPEPIVEASGWAVNKKGEVVLTANLSAGDRGSWHKDVPCSATHAHQ